MSLQDDYYDLSDFLAEDVKNKPMLKAFNRIWSAFCDQEAEQETLLRIRGAVRTMVECTFEQPTTPKKRKKKNGRTKVQRRQKDKS